MSVKSSATPGSPLRMSVAPSPASWAASSAVEHDRGEQDDLGILSYCVTPRGFSGSG